jgi:hypothetical protein
MVERPTMPATRPAFLLLAFACRQGDDGPLSPGKAPDSPQVCRAPVDGFARFTRSADARGLQTSLPPTPGEAECGHIPGAIVAADLDGDGDDDLLINREEDEPVLAWNDGGRFSEAALGLGRPTERGMELIAAVDLDGDALPELVAVGQGYAALAPNRGGGAWGPWELFLYDAEYPLDCYQALAFGDLDSDGDLDLVIPGLDRAEEPGQIMGSFTEGWRGSVDLLFRNDDGTFVLDRPLLRAGHEEDPTLALQAMFTDRDLDGDVDLFVSGDRSNVGFPPSAFFRNDGFLPDGRVDLVDDAAAVGAAIYTSAMGLGVNDLNQDGLLDYCTSDVALSLSCLLSSPGGGYADAGRALGLAPDVLTHPDLPAELTPEEIAAGRFIWSTWSLVQMDLDNDGHLDMAAVAGPPPDRGSVALSSEAPWQPDWIWKGTADGLFVSQMLETGFADPAPHYGMVPVDLDRDGHRELIVTGYEGVPEVWENPCGSGHWLDIRVGGAARNQDALGAIVTVEADDRVDIQEVRGPVSVAQAPLSLHIGLGDTARAQRVHVRWPDGAEVTLEDVEANQHLRVDHP